MKNPFWAPAMLIWHYSDLPGAGGLYCRHKPPKSRNGNGRRSGVAAAKRAARAARNRKARG